MTVRLSIGDFSRMTHLSIKALRRYHDMDLLVPADVDSMTSYRYYDAAQVPVGQVIRRFRDLGMPLEQVKEVLQAGDASSRNEVIVAHLRHMESELEQTQRTVASLRALLEKPPAPVAVEYRSVRPTLALAIVEEVAAADVETWWVGAFLELRGLVASTNAARTGPDGALYPSEFFEDELGEVVAYLPVGGQPEPLGRAQLVEIPGAELAVAVHEGPFGELDQAYGALGTFVAEREIGVEGPIREHYLVGFLDTDDESLHRTEVCWPVFRTKG
jgi:DNA-binding transcriptional MerR regulator/effector-binding domain-containing protein